MSIRFFLSLALVALSGAAAADGPYSHYADGVTQPYIHRPPDGFIDDVQCLPGSRCVVKNALSPLAPTATQVSTFMFATGPSVGTDHYAFGVRGNPVNVACVAPSILLSNPFTGRGIALFPSINRISFENFSGNCLGGGGIVGTTSRSINFKPNQKYLVSVWANDTNTGYAIERYYYNAADRVWDYQSIGAGDCLSQAASHEDYLCARHAQDPASANRAFILHTQDLRWTVKSWYLD